MYEDARNRWLAQVALHPNDGRVLYNAAQFFGYQSLTDEIDLLKRARALEPGLATEPLARLYSAALTAPYELRLKHPSKDASTAAQIRTELASSNDVALVGMVAHYVVERGARATLEREKDWDFTGTRYLATELVTNAQALDPQNRDWPELMEGVREFGVGLPPASQPALPDHATIRLDPEIARGMLQESPPPNYPTFAKAAGIEGVVKLEIHIGVDGHVTEALVLSGPWSLNSAAIEAATHYVYRPTVLKGEAVEVLTNVEIPFRL